VQQFYSVNRLIADTITDDCNRTKVKLFDKLTLPTNKKLWTCC